MTDMMKFRVPLAYYSDPDGALEAFLRSIQDAGAPLNNMKVVWRHNYLLGMDITPDDSPTGWPLVKPGEYVVWDGERWGRETGDD